MFDERRLLLKKIEQMNVNYNDEMKAITSPFSSPGYHTTLTEADGYVHSTRTAAYYALALFDSELEQYAERACLVLQKIIDTQDTNPNNNTYGIWSWFYEEPLIKMSPPDWNWADFIGKPLLLILKRHSHKLPHNLKSSVIEAISHACRAIIKRNVGPNYTNIAIMGAFVTLLAGELLEDEQFINYGTARLERFYHLTMELGTFLEFNSPTYTTIAIEELNCILTEVSHQKVKSMTMTLLDIAWKTLAERFHLSTKQWVGPHARAYGKLLRSDVQSFLQLTTKGAVTFFNEDEINYTTTWYNSNLKCPEHYLHYFTIASERHLKQLLPFEPTGGQPRPFGHIDSQSVATSYLSEKYALSSYSLWDLWNQRSSLLAYFAAEYGPIYMQLRALRNYYDFSSAILSASQHKNKIIFGVCFATDGGDTHINLDMIKNETITASDFRLRIEFGGAIDQLQLSLIESEGDDGVNNRGVRLLRLVNGSRHLCSLSIEAAVFADYDVKFVINQDKEGLYFDIVLYEGKSKEIRLNELAEAFIVGQCVIDDELLSIDISHSEYKLAAKANFKSVHEQGQLYIELPTKPASLEAVISACRSNVTEV